MSTGVPSSGAPAPSSARSMLSNRSLASRKRCCAASIAEVADSAIIHGPPRWQPRQCWKSAVVANGGDWSSPPRPGLEACFERPSRWLIVSSRENQAARRLTRRPGQLEREGGLCCVSS